MLPTIRERFALTLWFVDAAERALSAEKRRAQEHTKALQQQESLVSSDACPAAIPSANGPVTAPIVPRSSTVSAQPYFISTAGSPSGVLDSEKNAIVYQVKFADPGSVGTTAVDIVEHTVLRVHCTEHSYEQLAAPILLPPRCRLHEQSTTAKYSKKKEILTISIQCVYEVP